MRTIERRKKEENMEYFVIPYTESLENSGYHNSLTFSLNKWLSKPYASLEEACQIADNLAKEAFHDGRLITTFAVVKNDGWDIHHFQDSYEAVYETACNEQAEKAYWSGSNQTSVWFCPEEDILDSLPQDKEETSFEDWFNGLQKMKKNGRWHDRVAFFKDAASAIRFLKSEWANTDEFVLTIQKNGRKINLSNQFFRFGNVLAAQASDFRNGVEEHRYVWHVGGQTFPSYGDAVIYVLESDEYNFDDITKTKRENVAA